MNVGDTIQLATKQSSLTKKHASFLQKLSKIIIDCHFQSPLLSQISAITEYLQLFSQALLIYPTQVDNDSRFFQAFFYCAKLINPSNLLEFQENSRTTMTVYCLILVWLVFRYGVYLYIILTGTVLNKKEISPFWLKTFRIVFNFQAKFLYYFTSSFWVCAILAYKETKFSLFGFGEAAQYVFCIVIILAEFLITMLPRLCFYYILPNRGFLASKNNYMENITLFQKFIIQILQISLLLDSRASQWILVIVNLLISALRGFHFLAFLPFYNIKSLYFHGGLLAAVTSLNLSSFIIQLIFQSFDHHLLIIIWIILGVLSFKIAAQVLTKKLLSLVNQQEDNNIRSPLLLVHKMNLIKQFLTFQEKSQLLLNKNISREFYITSMTIQQENNLEMLKTNTITYFEQLYQKCPNKDLFGLHLAYYSAKLNKAYGKSIMLIKKMQQEKELTLQANGSFLLSKIQGRIKIEYMNKKLVLDLHTFVQSEIYVDELKQKMLEESELQSKVYRELTQNSPNLHGIFAYTQKVKSNKRKIELMISHLLDRIPLQCLSPLMLCANYYLILNNSPDDYDKFKKKFHLQSKKFKTQFEAENLCHENLYDDNSTAFFLVSAEKQDLGKVFYCSNSVKKVYGGDVSQYLGVALFSNIALPSLRSIFEEEYKALAQRGIGAGLDKIRRCYNLHKEGHIIEVDVYKNLHPMVTQGFYLTLVAREITRKNEFIMIRENGDIEGGSKKITKQLGIYIDNNSSSSKYHIRQISEELGRVNEAFNLINSISKQKRTSRQIMEMGARKNSSLTVKEASDLYSLYSEKGEGGILILNPVKEIQGKTYNYHCKISFYVFQALTFKIITLEDKFKNPLKRNSKFLLLNDLGPLNNPHIALNSSPELENDAKASTKNFDEDETPRTPKSSNEDERSEDFVSNEEKDRGWIDFAPLQSRQTEAMSPRTTERRALFETIPDSRRETNELFVSKAFHIQINSQEVKKRASLAEKSDTNQNSRDKATSLKRSNSINTIKALHTILETKHYAPSYRLVSFCYTLFILSVAAATFYMFLSTKNTTQILQVKTDTMVNSQTKAYYLVTTETLIRSLHDKKLGLIGPADAALYQSSILDLVAIGRKYIKMIVQTNRVISHNADYLDKPSRDLLYAKDVEIIYQDSVAYMSNFQATDAIVQAILDALNTYQNNLEIDETTFYFLIINLMNDLDTKNDQISDLLLKSVTAQVQGLKKGFLTYMGIVLGLCLLLSGVIIGQIWTQYQKCIKNALGLLHLDQQSLKLLIENQTNFQRALKGISNFDEIKFYTAKELSQEGSHHKSSKRSYSANYKGIKSSFLFIFFKFITLLIILSLVMILTKISAPNLMVYLDEKMYQMSFLSTMATVATRAISASIELPLANDTIPIGGQLMSTALQEYIGKIDVFKRELVDLFLNTEGMPNQMQTVLYGDGCGVLGVEDALFCGILKQNSADSSLIQVMGAFQSLLQERYLNYENSNRSSEALRKNRLLKIDMLLSLKRVIADECILVNKILKSDFERHLVLFNNQKDIAFYVSIIWLLIAARIIWKSILGPLRENDNKFKDILRIFPAKLVISNFIFKVFLMKASPNSLYFLKT